MTNVIAFPKAKKDTPPLTMEELYENVESTRKEHVEFVMDEILSFAFARAAEEGFNLADEDCLKTTALLVESFRSALYNSVGIDHPFHPMAEDVFKITDENDETVDILSKDE